jgi:uncharacterized protein YjbJ (UPF0337 family)
MTGSQVSLGSGFGDLMWYLTDKNPERVQFMETYNLNSTRPDIIAQQMEQTARQSSRCQQPLYHTSLNWHPQDQPTKEQMQTVAEGYLDHMGLGEHQAVVVAHNDTANPHVHIAVNRIHPEREKAWELDTYIGKGRDRKVDQFHNERVQHYLEMKERQYGWHRVEGKYRTGREIAEEASPTRSEYHREQRKNKQMDIWGVDPEELDTRAPRLRAMDVKDDLFDCASFQELDEVLDSQGLWIEAKGQGAVFTDGIHSVKASAINRQLSGGRLEERFGEDLGEYIAQREQHVNAELGYRQLADWSQDLTIEELEKVSFVLDGKKDKQERKLNHFTYLEDQFNTIMDCLPEQFRAAYSDGEQAYQRFGSFLNDYEGSSDEAVAELIETPERFGAVEDPSQIVEIADTFGEARALREQMTAHVKELPGSSVKDKKKQLKGHAKTAKSELKKVNKRIVKHLKSDKRDVLYDPQAEQAKRTMKSGLYKALSLHCALTKVYSGAQSQRNKELRTLLGNVGVLLTNPQRGSVTIMKQAVKVAGQKLLDRGRGMSRGR